MEAIRKVIMGTDLPSSFDLPENFKGKKLEIIIIPYEEDTAKKKTLKKAGSLREFANPEWIKRESTAWEKAVRDKYENSGC